MNLRTTIGPKLVCTLILCLWILSTAQRAEAGPILVGGGFGETPEAFRVLVLHGAINQLVVVHNLIVPGTLSWNVTLSIAEIDGGAGMADSVGVLVMVAQHKVGVPGHPGEGPNVAVLFNVTTFGPPFVPGVNVRTDGRVIDHPPILGHSDQFGATLTFTVANDGLSITGYELEVFGFHCFPQCPQQLPPLDKSLEEIPEWNALMLFGSGLVGLLGYVRRRRR